MGNVHDILNWCENQIDAGIHIPKDLKKMFEDYCSVEDKEALRHELSPSPTPEDDERMKKIILKDGNIKASKKRVKKVSK